MSCVAVSTCEPYWLYDIHYCRHRLQFQGEPGSTRTFTGVWGGAHGKENQRQPRHWQWTTGLLQGMGSHICICISELVSTHSDSGVHEDIPE